MAFSHSSRAWDAMSPSKSVSKSLLSSSIGGYTGLRNQPPDTRSDLLSGPRTRRSHRAQPEPRSGGPADRRTGSRSGGTPGGARAPDRGEVARGRGLDVKHSLSSSSSSSASCAADGSPAPDAMTGLCSGTAEKTERGGRSGGPWKMTCLPREEKKKRNVA
ncbi:hypothetical protein EYF80_042584 [Liparis tanakae]|uniref:Uncharacterized protein n=1 Tax=Liparis tanakae TaxID=230148 RepID=A0A4Z2G108_9TELE|nr:hypothetical protein EYF80_042584 [Liparis tanakae]